MSVLTLLNSVFLPDTVTWAPALVGLRETITSVCHCPLDIQTCDRRPDCRTLTFLLHSPVASDLHDGVTLTSVLHHDHTPLNCDLDHRSCANRTLPQGQNWDNSVMVGWRREREHRLIVVGVVVAVDGDDDSSVAGKSCCCG